MKNQLIVGLFLIGLGILYCGCSNMTQSPPLPLNRNFELTKQQRDTLQVAAKHGDGVAAYRLFQYYAFVEFDRSQYMIWLERAANLGYRPAIISLGNLLCESSEPRERERGRKLLRKVGAKDPTVPL